MSDPEVEAVAPLDAYATAKPDEPTFTLQGGDPLAPPLVRAWAFLARRRAGLLRFEQDTFSELIEAAIGHSVEGDEREVDNLKVRATAAEQVSWQMDAYQKDEHATDRPTEAEDTHLDELARIDLHDVKVRVAQKLSNFRCEMVDMWKVLMDAGFNDRELLKKLELASQDLSWLSDKIEPRRVMKRNTR